MEHKHSVYDTDTHFVIDPVTRAIKIGENTKTTLVQTDHNSEVYTFDIPRIIDGHDMMLCNLIEVHYDNIDSATKEKSKGFYKVEDMQVSADNSEMLCFTWLIKEPATKFVGKIEFSIKFKCIEDGKVAYRWNTIKNKDLTVEASNDNSEVATEEPYPDIIGQWEESLFGIGDTEEQRLLDVSAEQQAAIAAKGEEVLAEAERQKEAITARGEAVKASIPADYSALSALADQNRRNKAGAIVLDAEGESIVLNDASEYPLVGLKVFGKSEQFKTTGAQLVDFSVGTTATGVTATFENDALTVVGDGSLPYQSWSKDITALITEHPGEILSFNYGELVLAENHDGSIVQLNIANTDGTNTYYQLVSISGYKKTYSVPADTSGIKSVHLAVYSTNNATAMANTVTIKKPIFHYGLEAAEYEPYTGRLASPSPEYPQEINSVENAVVTVCGKNLLDYEKWKQVPIHGGTATFENNGVVITSNDSTEAYTSYSTTYSRIPCICGVKYVFSWEHSGTSGLAYIFPNGETDNMIRINTSHYNAMEYTPDDGVEFFSFRVGVSGANSTATYKNLQINVAEIQEFEPYKEPQTVTISHTLPGIPVSSGGNYTDANGKQWACDVVDLARGVHVHKCGYYIFDGSDDEEWNGIYTHDSKKYVYIKVPRGSIQYTTPLICNYAKMGAWSSENVCFINNYAEFVVGGVALESVLTSVAAFKTHLANNPIVLAYVLETPTETALPDTEINAYKALCTNKPNTTILNDAGAYMAVEYVADTKTYIDNKIAELMAK